MNTKKALIVIMVLLILLNVGMVGYIISLNVKNSNRIDFEEYTVKILKARNIELNCLIPTSSPVAATASLGDMLYTEDSIGLLETKTGGEYQLDDFGRMLYWGAPDANIVEGEMNRAAVEKISHAFIESIELQLSDYTLDYSIEIGTDEYDVRYIKKDDKGNHYYDIYIEMIINETGVASAVVSIRSIEDEEKRSGESLPVHTVLLANLIAESKPMTISSISYGYHQKSANTSEAVMSWRVRFSDGSERFFEVGTGEEITPVIEILEFNNVIFKCPLPESYTGPDEIIYGESRFDQQQLDSMLLFANGQATIDSYGYINYIRTSFENSTRYALTDEVITELSYEFIEDLGLDSSRYVKEGIEAVSDGSFKDRYVYSDSNGNLIFGNFIEIHYSELGVVFASIRADEFTDGSQLGDFKSLSGVLLERLDIDSGREYVVTQIDPGYIRETIISDKAVACWRVVYEDNTIQYFSAVSGEELNIDE